MRSQHELTGSSAATTYIHIDEQQLLHNRRHFGHPKVPAIAKGHHVMHVHYAPGHHSHIPGHRCRTAGRVMAATMVLAGVGSGLWLGNLAGSSHLPSASLSFKNFSLSPSETLSRLLNQQRDQISQEFKQMELSQRNAAEESASENAAVNPETLIPPATDAPATEVPAPIAP